ncbi:MAG: polysaccharide biosynthesis/export family protein [Candidatus Margulisbacteria bacterium]|nr:polysaccharide biosynthesis/export family protein [Candidatus Margulisiibacteriota bacterium]
MKKNITKLILVCFCFSLLSVSFTTTPAYILASGDNLEIKVINKKELDTKQTIAPDGSISLPTIGRMKVIGLSLDDLQKKVKASYSQYIKNADVVVFLTPRPIFVVQQDQVKKTWEVKKAESPAEALAYMGQSSLNLQSSNLPTIQYGDVVTVNIGKSPDFWEDNWYKVLSAIGIAAGVWAVVAR